jgi:membrane-associated phospholipid phosphatase
MGTGGLGMKRMGFMLYSTVFLILMGIFTFFDLPLSMAVVNQDSAFGLFFAAFGQLTMPVILGFCFASLAALTSVPIGRILYLLCSYAACASAFYMLLRAPYFKHFAASDDVLFWCSVLTGGLLLCFLLFPKAAKLAFAYPAALSRAAWIGILTFVAATLAVEGLKDIMGRMRFRAMTDPYRQFTPWFLPKGPAANDSFKSFPSGHSFRAAYSLWVVFLPASSPKESKSKHWLVFCAVVWTLSVMISRIIVGAHFATDVLFGSFLPIVCFWCFGIMKRDASS